MTRNVEFMRITFVLIALVAILSSCGAGNNDQYAGDNIEILQNGGQLEEGQTENVSGQRETDGKTGNAEKSDDAEQKKGSGPANSERMVQIETEFGIMKAKLYNSTPRHRDNFLKLASEGFYDGLLLHRVVPGFVIQGGDPDSRDAPLDKILGQGGPGYDLPAEIRNGLLHKRGALAAARLGDDLNPRRESSGSQFYVVQGFVWNMEQLAELETTYNITLTAKQKEVYTTIGGLPSLDDGYTIFGEVIEGLEVIDAIANVKCNPINRPLKDVHLVVKVLE